MQTGTQKAQLGVVGNLVVPVHARTSASTFENFYTHSGRDEGRFFQGINLDNAREYQNYRLQFIEEGLMSNAVGGEHFFQGLVEQPPRLAGELRARDPRRAGPARDALRAAVDSPARASRSIRSRTPTSRRAASACSTTSTTTRRTRASTGACSAPPAAGRRSTSSASTTSTATRDFRSRRFHFIPITTQKADAGNLLFDPLLPPEELFAPSNIGTAFRFNEETRPTDAYDGDQTTTSGYGMVDIAMTARTRLIAGARVERFDQTVTTQDPFGLFVREVQADEQEHGRVSRPSTSCRPSAANSNIRLSYSTTVNRPEFRELAEFEFTDVVGNRAVKGNPDLKRALIQNVDGRWEMFSGGRGVVAASVFYKYFDKPIERVVIAAANPIATFQNSDHARNFGIELEAGHQLGEYFFVNANYTFVDSKITLLPEQRTCRRRSERPLAGQSKNLFNVTARVRAAAGSRRACSSTTSAIASPTSAPTRRRTSSSRAAARSTWCSRSGFAGLSIRLTLENLTDSDYLFTQTLATRRDAAALQARPHRRAVVRLQRVLRPP